MPTFKLICLFIVFPLLLVGCGTIAVNKAFDLVETIVVEATDKAVTAYIGTAKADFEALLFTLNQLHDELHKIEGSLAALKVTDT